MFLNSASSFPRPCRDGNPGTFGGATVNGKSDEAASKRVVEAELSAISRLHALEFSEANGQWGPAPPWVRYLIDFGYLFGAQPQDFRRIGIISMPCESAGAGLVALGALRYRLSLAGADDAHSHFDRLCRLATSKPTSPNIYHPEYGGPFLIKGTYAEGALKVEMQPPGRRKKRLLRVAIFPDRAVEWQIEDEPPVMQLEGDSRPYLPIYEHLVEGSQRVIPSNLVRSDSAICLAGRVAGEIATREALSQVRFRIGNQPANLAELATVHGWSNGAVSRLTFFNSRTEKVDRCPAPPIVVVADGDLALLKVLSAKAFYGSHVLGVVHRAVERDRLESLGNALNNQWYSLEGAGLPAGPVTPNGIAVSLLRGRAL